MYQMMPIMWMNMMLINWIVMFIIISMFIYLPFLKNKYKNNNKYEYNKWLNLWYF
uniref:ATP synthase F0 subunit 8 n=1 Tax=Scolia bicincta TaxID=427966 RepID=A0A1L2D331_9HYME|nr:ATP synthase F0 subunit 8 [Scolia bicincta]